MAGSKRRFMLAMARAVASPATSSSASARVAASGFSTHTAAPAVAASDYVKALCGSACRWIPARTVTLGTDGFGRSDGRAALRDFFEVDARHVALAALSALVRNGSQPAETAIKARDAFGINSEKANPIYL